MVITKFQFYNSLVRYFDRKKIYNFEDKKLFLENYVNTLSKIKLIAESYGSQFIHVLQPHIEFKNLKSPKRNYSLIMIIEKICHRKYNFISKQLINITTTTNVILSMEDYYFKILMKEFLVMMCTFIIMMVIK